MGKVARTHNSTFVIAGWMCFYNSFVGKQISDFLTIMNMAITDNEIQMALRIKRCVKEFFDTHNKTEIEAKELMPLFIKKDIFKSNHQDGLPIRDFLRHLEKEKYLNLIPQALYKQKNTNKNWFFIKPYNDVGFQ